jgi:hypothetical protein
MASATIFPNPGAELTMTTAPPDHVLLARAVAPDIRVDRGHLAAEVLTLDGAGPR